MHLDELVHNENERKAWALLEDILLSIGTKEMVCPTLTTLGMFIVPCII